MISVFKRSNWFCTKFDGRKKEFRGISREDFEKACKKHFDRIWENVVWNKTKTQQFKEKMEYFSRVPYEYQGDGLDDFNEYQRPASNGIGYVAICPGERCNNVYVDEPHLVSALMRKYNEYLEKSKK